MRNLTLILSAVAVLAGCQSPGINEAGTADTHPKPNIIVFYVDDLGYGDLGAYGAKGVETPNVDRLADDGLLFTDAHSTAATCTPSRYSLLTGEHGFRVDATILKGDAPALIKPGKPTLPAMLQKAGYTTGIVGKWHLGLGDGNLDWNGKIAPGPLEVGFDSAFLLPATGDRVPTVYVDNHHVVGLDSSDPIEVNYEHKVGSRPDGISNPGARRVKADEQHSQTIVNGVSRIGYMGGGENALWDDEDFPDVFTGKAVEFIRENKDKPFFLFHSFHDIHVPHLPNSRFQGKSSMGPRGDAIVQMDWMVGQVMEELERQGLSENTLVIFTSDNGPVLFDGYFDGSFEKLGDHQPAGPFRGGKTSLFEAGTRVPTILHWPAEISAGDSDALLSQVDLYASLAALVNQELEYTEAIDSLDMLDAFLGRSQTGRDYLLEEGSTGIALRQGRWKYIPASKDKNGKAVKPVKMIETGWSRQSRLYDLEVDVGERINLAKDMPGKVAELQSALDGFVAGGFRGQPVVSSSQPNIILIVTDDQGYADVGFNGSTEIPTPHIDRIANEGVRFDQGYVSYPVCGPSRAGFMTGRYQGRFGFTTNPTMNPAVPNAGVRLDEDMISEVLKTQGYSTKAIGKWHLGIQPDYQPRNQGFDEFFGFLSGGHQYFPELLTLNSMQEVIDNETSWYYMRLLDNGERVDIDKYLTDALSDRAVDFIERKEDEPFFLYLAYNAPHTPYQATQKYLDRFPHIEDEKRRTYAAMISAVDDGVGAILDKLDELDIADDTLIFFLSDNGGPINKSHVANNGVLRAGKGSLFEGGVRVPFAMRWPDRIEPGMDFDKPISSLDIMATVAAQTGATIAEERPLDGVDLLPYLNGEKSGNPHDVLFWRQLSKESYAVRRGDMKMVLGEGNKKNAQLFDISQDISESSDIADEHDPTVEELLRLRDEWEEELEGQAFPELRSWRPWIDERTGKAKKKKKQPVDQG